MPSLQLQLLGHFRLLYNDEPVTGVTQARVQALLAYLTLHRDTVQTRQHLAFRFWPESSESQARTNLRKTVYDLRQAFPPIEDFLYINDHVLHWRQGVAVTLDLATFADLLAQAGQVDERSTLQTILMKAIELYRGDLLPDCYEDWIIPQREQLRQDYLATLGKLIRLLEEQRAYPSAIAYAQQLLQADPLQESTYRILMHLYVRNGDRALALRTYHICTTLIQQELGVAPGPETQAAHQRLLHLDSMAITPEAPISLVLRGGVLLVGRQAEWAILQAAWRTAASGQPSFVLIAGEAGIGKSRLAEELRQWIDRQGSTTGQTRCYAAEGRLAYAPVTAWLRTEAIRSKLLAMESIWLEEVARLLPELLVERPDLVPPPPLVDSWQRQRFWEALARALLLTSHRYY
jgi:DNA-binding SARP family transcriptional activator